MGLVNKLSIEKLPRGFSPKKLPGILQKVKEMAEESAIVYEGIGARPALFETDRLIIRRFHPDDVEAVMELARNREQSVMKNYDHAWPTDDQGCKGATEWLATQETMWAACLKRELRLIGMITFNSVDPEQGVDLGHVWHTDFWNEGLDTEALSLLVRYAFEHTRAASVYAGNPLECEPQLAPLHAIGMEIVETREASFATDGQGRPIVFTGCKMAITREQWVSRDKASL
ncbi:GNAT family N-acetyltransferase [Gorillibacterium sp. CAU 1737]|uniref:GNAT family N-acetyltransferase n=1 Tax=Gorillibacterium sp. CAU 1737 TaxID=3140362 RepID=UPI003261085E